MTSPTAADERALRARAWALAELGLADAGFAPASADASFRRYFRVSDASRSWIVMDAPPDRENCAPFVRVAALLHAAGVHAPQILAFDPAQGFMLLSDLGRQTFLQVLDAGNADALFDDAVNALLRWQRSSRADVLPPYDRELLDRELALFPDWFVTHHLGRPFDARQQAAWAGIRRDLIRSAVAQPRVYVHRDYMPRNLMVSTPNPGVLDFQDAVEGPITYDAVCLFRDAFISWPEERVEDWARRYWDRARDAWLPVDERFEDFRRAFDWMGVQRHLKVIGIFARINYRDGKPQYLADVPRFVVYVRTVASRYPALAPLLRLFDELGLQA